MAQPAGLGELELPVERRVILRATRMSSCKLIMKTIVQISLDFTSIHKALETARLAVRAGVDWLEAGTPLIISEGMNSIRTDRKSVV